MGLQQNYHFSKSHNKISRLGDTLKKKTVEIQYLCLIKCFLIFS